MSDWQVEMADIIHDIATNLVAKHGTENRGILALSDFHLDGTTYCVFVGKEEHIEYAHVLPEDLENADLMQDLKYTPPEDKRCEGIEIFIKSGKVETKILYPEDSDRKRDEFEVRNEVVHSYFGEGKIVYPPMPKGVWDDYEG
jgi:hypothetical protein